ncbi:CTP synthase [Clavibacter michiganensis subsp. michiganensis]|uniref:CTP synthase (glutamine hydrolyzing) n=1 Tax=Clavibacter michiganensis subsp. michiganensis TaxID=33013 RepID=A0A251XH88_CLAMM|nr:CTP synthase [Clavibacter michiganensis subsp. michiganensis]OUE02445.1 CTP synthase [Clavibacter michiganensis subsp. michiganensis]
MTGGSPGAAWLSRSPGTHVGWKPVADINSADTDSGTTDSNTSTTGAAKTTRHIFVTGGVVSSLGKGLTAASLGNLLTARGVRVVMQKLDPYLNVDPGTMNPFQHGEVFVTDDGAETDLDIGHYERFLDIELDQAANVTTGQIYSEVIAKERRGEYLGDTVQVIPHITDEIKRRMRLQASDEPQPDVIITEIGGTVGDIESQPFIEAARQVRHELGRNNVFFVHVSLVPYMGASGEQKTKPTQHSVAALRSIGIQPDALVLRSDRPVSDSNKKKIALMCDVDEQAVVNAVDVPSIYDIPEMLHGQGLDSYIIDHLGLTAADAVDWSGWSDLLDAVHDPKHEVTVGLVGKYIDLPDAYLSVTEALRAGGFAHSARVKLRWVASDECETPEGAAKKLGDLDALCVPGGFGIRGIEGKLGALKFARDNGSPCSGCASASSAWSSSTRATRRASPAPPPPSSTPTASSRSSRRWPSRSTSSRAATWAAPCASASTRRRSRPARSRPSCTARPSPTSATATATRSTTSTATGSRTPASCSRARRPTARSSSTWSCPARCTPSTSARRRTRSCGRARTARTRCSPA